MALSREERNARVREARAAKAAALAKAGLPRSLAYGKAPKGQPTLSARGLDARRPKGAAALDDLLKSVGGLPRLRAGGPRQRRHYRVPEAAAAATGVTDVHVSSSARYLRDVLRQAADSGQRVSIRSTWDTDRGPRTVVVDTLGSHRAITPTSDRPIDQVQLSLGRGGVDPLAILAWMDAHGWTFFDWLEIEVEQGWWDY